MADKSLFDTSDVDRWIGVPIGGGEIIEDIHVNDIRRWAQAMQNPNPLHYDKAWADGQPLRPHHRAAVVHGELHLGPRRRALDPGRRARHAHAVRRRRVVVLRTARRARRRVPQRQDAVRLPRARHGVRGPDDLLARRHELLQPARGAGRQAALHVDPLPGRRGAEAREGGGEGRAGVVRRGPGARRGREDGLLQVLPRSRPREAPVRAQGRQARCAGRSGRTPRRRSRASGAPTCSRSGARRTTTWRARRPSARAGCPR